MANLEAFLDERICQRCCDPLHVFPRFPSWVILQKVSVGVVQDGDVHALALEQ